MFRSVKYQQAVWVVRAHCRTVSKSNPSTNCCANTGSYSGAYSTTDTCPFARADPSADSCTHSDAYTCTNAVADIISFVCTFASTHTFANSGTDDTPDAIAHPGAYTCTVIQSFGRTDW